MMVPAPEKLRLSSGISPPKISQIASKSMPRFVVSLIAIRRGFPRLVERVSALEWNSYAKRNDRAQDNRIGKNERVCTDAPV